ncbi:hypothetical protein H5410_041122 [Solanum commersonii]|uniref:Uncharacterized protein n=1 Tax=Solanum commersonii TaxID=4109 RepID=A0A9J5XTX3_SOLCO|nr:hypothetical protein H5410_041122 [Solanum commersonii]
MRREYGKREFRRDEKNTAFHKKVKSTMKMTSQCVAEQFREEVPYHPTTQNAKRLKAKEGR